VQAVGRVNPKELVAVGAQVSGQVKRLHVVLGQRVQAGDLIAEVDSQPQRIALRSAEAAANALRAQHAASQRATPGPSHVRSPVAAGGVAAGLAGRLRSGACGARCGARMPLRCRRRSTRR
jgi:multidrug efflux pump subunit AcrA (membrane-fusion protein)